ncbi:MAG TPA: hypothetical protein VHT52_04190 [Stellaceae bacterium]|jgi:hypothetical protein|nr:hypothetical protein [Stellaceae bacterium]
MKRLRIIALALVIATPAVARCPYGQILRVSMGKCVSWHSRLASGYVHVSRARMRVAIRLPAARPQPIERPEIEVLRERLAHPAPLTATDILLSRAAALVQ